MNRPCSQLKVQDGELAFHHQAGAGNSMGPGVLFCGGFHSSMQGTKALYLESACRENGWQFTRFNYRGHGASSDDFARCHIGHWLEDTLAVLDEVCTGSQIIIGSSMGAWLAVLATLARPGRVAALMGLASAPDFTEELVWPQLDADARALLATGQPWYRPTDYDEGEPYAITRALIDSGRRHLVLQDRIDLHCPVRLIHGTADADVPVSMSERLMLQLDSDDVTLTLIKQGDHRLSTPVQLQTIGAALGALVAQVSAC